MDETAASGSKLVAFNFEERVRLNVWILFEGIAAFFEIRLAKSVTVDGCNIPFWN